MPKTRTPDQVAVAFDTAARETAIRYAFVGAVAVGAWGQPRATSDVDCLVDLRADQDRAFAAALKKQGLSVNPEDFADARDDPGHVTAFDDTGGYHIDIKLARTPHEREEIQDASELDLGSGRIRVARAEETIAFKIAFGSEQDLKDARGIILRQLGKLDSKRLMHHAKRLGVERETKDLLDQCGTQ